MNTVMADGSWHAGGLLADEDEEEEEEVTGGSLVEARHVSSCCPSASVLNQHGRV